LVSKMVKPGKNEKPGRYVLKYISTGLQDTGQMNILNAKNEISKMAVVTEDMFSTFLDVFTHPDVKMGIEVDKVKRMEELTDQMQEEISRYLVECSNEELSEKSIRNVNALLRIVNELENVGDSCFKLIILTQKKYNRKLQLHERAQEEIKDFAKLVTEFMAFYKANLNEALDNKGLDIAFKMENKINHSRDNLKRAARKRLQEGADVNAELLYLDILKNFEHIGDNALNIAQALRNIS
ncbi:MAG: Na/Pi cotransporter family protein, partial [Candidatus Cloacimonetes bacterium]|nr:Na/Pi cotransporter family protein [Candidatus Cloacimonadota bacterium]